MNIQAMRDRFLEIVSEMAEAVPGAQIDAYFNRAYQFEIPSLVDGEFSETTWELETTASTETYAYPGYIVAPGNHAWISEGSVPITVMSNPVIFEHRFYYPSGTEGQPVAVLFYGRTAKIAPVPDAEYTIEIPSRGGPATALTDGSSIDNDAHAMAVIYAAAREFYTEIDDADGAMKADAALAMKIDQLRTISGARVRGRIPARSF
jgi:hypothetical protein